MRTHTAMHILCGVIWRDLGALVTGGNMEPLKARMDFELESMSADFAERVEAAINREIEAAREIRVRILPREEAFQISDLIRTKINLLPEVFNKCARWKSSASTCKSRRAGHARRQHPRGRSHQNHRPREQRQDQQTAADRNNKLT